MSDKTSIDKGYFGVVLILKIDLLLPVWDFFNKIPYQVIMF